MASNLEKTLIDKAKSLQRHITDILVSYSGPGEPSHNVMEDEFKGSDIEETTVKKTVQPAPSQANWDPVRDRNEVGEVQPPREQSTLRTIAQTV